MSIVLHTSGCEYAVRYPTMYGIPYMVVPAAALLARLTRPEGYATEHRCYGTRHGASGTGTGAPKSRGAG
eukprot:778412-Prorocentrum_minimum.AAC.2